MEEERRYAEGNLVLTSAVLFAVLWKADYDPFGEANVVVQLIESNFRFPGQWFDEETGLHQNWFRDYAPGLGRYVEADPLCRMDATGSYFVYVLDNPIVKYDPKGLREWKVYREGWGVSLGILGMSNQQVTFVSNCENNKRLVRVYQAIGGGLTFGLRISVWLSSKGYLGATTVERPVPHWGMRISGPSAGLGWGITLASASIGLNSFAEIYGLTTGPSFGASFFNAEGQHYRLIGEKVESCCQ